jgi:hypothetical protein
VVTSASPSKIAAVPSPVHVEVDHEHAACATFGPHRLRGDGRVVEHAEALAVCAVRVVGPTSEVDAKARCKRAPAGGQSVAPSRAPGALDHRGRPREADASPARVRQSPRATAST